MAIIVEDGSGIPEANSYVSFPEASELLAELGITTEWTTIGQPRGEALLARASSQIDLEWAFRGVPKSEVQGLAVPRVGMRNRDGREILGNPRPLREATSELAYWLSQQKDVISDTTVVEEVRAGPINIKLGGGSTVKKLLPDSVKQKLSAFGSAVFSGRRSRRLA